MHLQGPLNGRKMSYQKHLRDGLLVLEMREETFAILQTRHARGDVDKVIIKRPKRGRAI